MRQIIQEWTKSNLWKIAFKKAFDFPSPDQVDKKRACLKNFFMLIPENFSFSHEYIILAMLTLESNVNFLFFLLHHFLDVRVVLIFLTHCPLLRFHQTLLH